MRRVDAGQVDCNIVMSLFKTLFNGDAPGCISLRLIAVPHDTKYELVRKADTVRLTKVRRSMSM